MKTKKQISGKAKTNNQQPNNINTHSHQPYEYLWLNVAIEILDQHCNQHYVHCVFMRACVHVEYCLYMWNKLFDEWMEYTMDLIF